MMSVVRKERKPIMVVSDVNRQGMKTSRMVSTMAS